MALIQCDIVSAEKEIFSGEVEMVIAAGSLGDVGVAYGHAPLLTQLQPGPIRVINEGGEEDVYFISGGMLEIQPKVITVLADTAVRADDIDEASAQQAQEKARHALANQSSEIDYSTALAELAEAAARIRTIQQIRKKMGG
ncbi:MAG TPA: F0F1 ATP synthase subunit epsilon [Pseudomonadales bacterium]